VEVTVKTGVLVAAFTLLILFPVQALATLAMCPNCGEIHFGALVPCDKCGFDCKKDTDLIQACILFSDHNWSVKTLENFGKVMRDLRPVFPDFSERFWAFLQYIADKYPDSGIINAQIFRLPGPLHDKIISGLKGLNLPVFEIEKKPR